MAALSAQPRVCVFAKPPRAGQAKTRLVPALGAEGAAALARALLSDTWACVAGVGWARAVVASTAPADAWPPGALPTGAEVWLQGEGDLGARLERVLRRALSEAPAALAVGADVPGLSAVHLEAARAALEGADAVLGPSEDGGYFLLGVRQLPAGALAGLPWSAPDTLVATEARLVALGLRVARIAACADVDTPEDLARLRAELAAGRVVAPATARVLAALEAPGDGR